ncbi:MAG TPA: DNA polymerase IV [Longimicrobiales bacterium]|nr:DNA polymerase IV [Longimicrobiales bacterium]
MTHRKILLVDCDQFFVQCARLADAEGAGREELLLVGGSTDSRGVVTSASYATRAFGVRSGMPTSQALRLCPAARVVPVPREMCSRKSEDVHRVLETFTPLVERASIDEAYLDLTGTDALYQGEPLVGIAQRVKDAVARDAGIAVSVGGASNKLVAKLAVRLAKPSGVHVVEPGRELDFMRGVELAAIPGIGPVFQEELRRFGLVRVEDALAHDRVTLSGWLGARGDWLFERIRGIDDAVVEPHGVAKSISRDETFARDLDRDDDLQRELLALAVRAAGDLREAGLEARTVTVRIRDSDFRNRSASRTLEQPVESDRAIQQVARALLATLRERRRTPARLLGVALSGFDGGAGRQLALFDEAAAVVETERDRELSRAVDDVRARFGRKALRPGRLIDE